MTILGKRFTNAVGALAIAGTSAFSSPALGQDTAGTRPVATVAFANGNNSSTASSLTTTAFMTGASENSPKTISDNQHVEVKTYDIDTGYIELDVLPYNELSNSKKIQKSPSMIILEIRMAFPEAIIITNWQMNGNAASARQNEILDKMLPALAEDSQRLMLRINIDANDYSDAYVELTPGLFKNKDKKAEIKNRIYIPVGSISMPVNKEFEGRIIRTNAPLAMLSYDQELGLSDSDHIRRIYRALKYVIDRSEEDLKNENKETSDLAFEHP